MRLKIKRWAKALFLSLSACLFINTQGVLAFDRASSLALSNYILAVMHEDLGQIDQAISEYHKSLKADNKNAVVHLRLAVAYLKKNNIPESIKELNLSIKFDSEAVEPHALLALLYATQNQAQISAKEYELAFKNAAKLEPQNVDIYKSLGALYLQQKKLEPARDTYRLILDLSPKDAQAHFYLANIYYELKSRDAAIKELKKTLELKPDYAEAMNYLGYLYVDENINLDQAEGLIRKALEIEPDSGAYIDSLGWFYFKKGKTQEALKELERAAGLMDDPVIFDHLGDAYLKTGDKEKAKDAWQKSLKLKPGQDKVKKK